MTLSEFRVELGHLRDTISTVKRCTTAIETDVAAVKQAFRRAESAWQSPSGASFGDLQREFDTHTTTLITLLHEMSRRMNAAYTTYHEVEEQNTKNFSKH